MTNLTGRRAPAQRTARPEPPISPKDFAAAVAVGRIESRFPHRYSRQLEHIDDILAAFRSQVAQLECERREVLARMHRL